MTKEEQAAKELWDKIQQTLEKIQRETGGNFISAVIRSRNPKAVNAAHIRRNEIRIHVNAYEISLYGLSHAELAEEMLKKHNKAFLQLWDLLLRQYGNLDSIIVTPKLGMYIPGIWYHLQQSDDSWVPLYRP